MGDKKQKLMIDYAVHYKKANGKHKEKVFKLKIINVGKGGEYCVE